MFRRNDLASFCFVCFEVRFHFRCRRTDAANLMKADSARGLCKIEAASFARLEYVNMSFPGGRGGEV